MSPQTASLDDTNGDHTEALHDSLLQRFYSQYIANQAKVGQTDFEEVLLAIERFVELIISHNDTGFKMVPTRLGIDCRPTLLGSAYFRRLNNFLDHHESGCCYSPYISLFYEAAKDVGLMSHTFTAPGALNEKGGIDAELFNKLIDEIRQKGREPAFKKKVAQESSHGLRRFLSMVRFVDALFDHVRSRLIVIRLDFRYRPEARAGMKVGQAQKDLKHFLRNMRNKPSLFSDLIGYIWKLETGDVHGGDHFHMIFFFTNDRLSNDSYRGEQIGQYWEAITNGRGRYFNCNRETEKAKQNRLAIGRIDYHDSKKRFNLLYLLAYLCKPDQKVRARPKKKSRMFGRREMPQVKTQAIGRPREFDSPSQGYLKHLALTGTSPA